jgi:hypothetical protein
MTASTDGGTIETIPLAMLTFVVGGLVLAHSWAVVAARDQAGTAAGAGVRAYVEATGPGARRSAVDAALATIDPARRAARRWEVAVSGASTRCGPATVRVTTEVPLMRLPWLGPAGAVTVTAARSEIVDPFRRGVSGLAVCGA